MPDPPHPLIEIAIAPTSEADREGLGIALQSLTADDPTLSGKPDPASGRTVIGGLSEPTWTLVRRKSRTARR
jgi:elongation factor G